MQSLSLGSTNTPNSSNSEEEIPPLPVCLDWSSKGMNIDGEHLCNLSDLLTTSSLQTILQIPEKVFYDNASKSVGFQIYRMINKIMFNTYTDQNIEIDG